MIKLECGDLMLSKFDYSKNFIENDEILVCPICKKKLYIKEHSLMCENAHNFNLSKKGITNLVSHNHIKESKIYNYDLFFNRRCFIQKMFYQKLYDKIVRIINKHFDKNINILDLGCGEGAHTINILNNLKLNYKYYGFDYSKIAIQMASDYNSNNRFYFVGDVNNIPIKDYSAHLIIDILSPYNQLEVKRVLKKKGLFIKVSPGKNYLKELRLATGISIYDKDTEVERNLEKNFKKVRKENILITYPITNEDFMLLLKMSPMQSEKILNKPNTITIDLNIYIMNGEEL